MEILIAFGKEKEKLSHIHETWNFRIMWRKDLESGDYGKVYS